MTDLEILSLYICIHVHNVHTHIPCHRDLYELRDLSDYPLDESDDNKEEEEDEDEDSSRSMKLSSAQRKHICEAVAVIVKQYSSMFFFWSIVGRWVTYPNNCKL